MWICIVHVFSCVDLCFLYSLVNLETSRYWNTGFISITLNTSSKWGGYFGKLLGLLEGSQNIAVVLLPSCLLHYFTWMYVDQDILPHHHGSTCVPLCCNRWWNEEKMVLVGRHTVVEQLELHSDLELWVQESLSALFVLRSTRVSRGW